MKKFIKSRLETPVSVAPGAPDPPLPPNHIKLENAKMPAWQTPEVQPPLPLEPPPPDYIPTVQVKQEIVHTEYQTTQPAPIEENQVQEKKPDQTNNHSTVICRDFMRGTCKREGTCKYAHKHDLTQLEGVYTFCRKFQNSVCTFPNCKFVHATVFEEQNFYRTGFLPDHAFNHRANNIFLQPPPPPPPEEPPVMPFNIDFSYPPPTFRNKLESSMFSCIPASSNEARGYYTGNIPNQTPMPTTSRSAIKRTRSEMEASSAPCDEILKERTKYEFWLEHYKNKVQKLLQSKEEDSKKISSLIEENQKQRSIIFELISAIHSQMNSNSSGDIYQTLMDALDLFFRANK